MAKGPRIKEEMKLLILTIKVANPDWSASQVRNRLRTDLGLKEKQAPKLRAVQYVIARNRSGLGRVRSSPLEKPWTVGSLRDVEVSSDCLTVLLEMQNQRLESKLPPLTIRQAKWVSRLLPSVLHFSEGKEAQTAIGMIEFWSRSYAVLEEACEITNADFDTSGIDQAFFRSRGDIKKGAHLMDEKGGGWVLLGTRTGQIRPSRLEGKERKSHERTHSQEV